MYEELMNEIKIYASINGELATVEKFERKILDMQVPRVSLWFCTTFKCANVKAHQEIIYAKGNADHIFHFAVHVVGADKAKAKELLLEKDDIRLLILFACLPDVDYADIDDYILKLKIPSVSSIYLSEITRYKKQSHNAAMHEELAKANKSTQSSYTYWLARTQKRKK